MYFFICYVHLTVMDTNDRFLRKITIGQGPEEKGMTREVKHSLRLFMHSIFVKYFISYFHLSNKISGACVRL